MRRVVLWIALVVTALLLQSVVFAKFQLGGAKPELIALLTIVVASLEGPAAGALAGFFGGIAEDFLLNQPKGITALTLTLVGYAVGMISQYSTASTPLIPVVLVAGGTAVAVIFSQLVGFLLGQTGVTFFYVVRVALLTAAYNALLTPIVYPVVRRLMEGSKSQRVFRL
jgi:rod shape-determining protein MreD